MPGKESFRQINMDGGSERTGFFRRRKDDEPRSERVERLSAVCETRDGRTIFVGWSGDIPPKPIVVEDVSFLGDHARESWEIFKAPGSRGRDLRSISFSRVVPVEAGVSEINAHNRREQEDVVAITYKDGNGDDQRVMVGEVDFLRAVAEALSNPWGDFSDSESSDQVREATAMYTIFLRSKAYDSGLALLFNLQSDPHALKPETDTNEAVFREFVARTLSALIANDERQPEGGRKGYVSTAVNFIGSEAPVDLGTAGKALYGLRRLGILRFTDQSLASTLRSLKDQDIVNVDEGKLLDLEISNRVGQIARLDKGRLMQMVQGMLSSVRSSLGSEGRN
jgi:hypothetical protein